MIVKEWNKCKKNHIKIYSENVRERDHFGDLDEKGRVMVDA